MPLAKQQLCPWCSLRQTFLTGPRPQILMCEFCGHASVREGKFLRRIRAKDTAGLTTEEIQKMDADGERIRRQHPAIEQHYIVREIAHRWRMSVSTVERLFENEPGVMRVGRHKRTIRIPLSVAERVHARLIG